MPDGLAPRASYDSIAHLYDVDMARNMAFDDAALYTQVAQRAGGRVLELGCGNGHGDSAKKVAAAMVNVFGAIDPMHC